MKFPTALWATLLIIMIDYVVAMKLSDDGWSIPLPDECQKAKGVIVGNRCIINAPEVKPGRKTEQAFPEKAVIFPPAEYKKNEDNGFKPLSKSENYQVQSICGTAEESFARIRNGYTAKPKQFPWIVDFGFCTGVLISPRHVLSAAHCFMTKPPDSDINDSIGDCSPKYSGKNFRYQTIGYGGNCRTKSTHCPSGTNMKRAGIERLIYPHGNDTYCIEDNDIALVLLKEDVEFSDYVRPICISGKLFHKNLVQLKDVGLGRIDDMTSTSIVRYMESNILGRRSYREVITYGIRNQEGFPNICLGDSGGPLQGTFPGSNRTYLAGIHSRGDLCRDKVTAAFTSYAPAYADWLCKLTGICELE